MIVYDDDLSLNRGSGPLDRAQALGKEMLDIIIDDDDTEVDRSWIFVLAKLSSFF